jgi:DNA-directed RNA polymerase III subunit RPC1
MQLYGFVVPLENFPYISHNTFQAIAPRSARGLLPYEILEIVDRELSLPKFVAECTPSYIASIHIFLNNFVAHRLAIVRKSRGMFEALERSDEWDEDTDLSMGATGNSSS